MKVSFHEGETISSRIAGQGRHPTTDEPSAASCANEQGHWHSLNQAGVGLTIKTQL